MDPYAAMELGKAYRFQVRRRGNTTPVEYNGVVIRKGGDVLTFHSLDTTATIRVEREVLDKDSAPVELDTINEPLGAEDGR